MKISAIERLPTLPLRQRIRKLFEKIPDDEVYSTIEISKKLDVAPTSIGKIAYLFPNNSYNGIRNGTTVKYWGTEAAIKKLKKRFQ